MSPFYQFDTGNIGGSLLAGVSGFMSVFVALYYIVVYGLALTVYILEAVSLYSIAKRRGVHHAWLAWVPTGNVWILGSISDQYQYVVRGRVRNRRKLLLGLNLVAWLINAVASILRLIFAFSQETAMAGPAVSVTAAVVVVILSIVTAVFYYIAMYDLYTSCNPQNNVMFLVLGILFQVTEPFFVFFNRNKDEGMPPRKDAPVEEPPAYTPPSYIPAPEENPAE